MRSRTGCWEGHRKQGPHKVGRIAGSALVGDQQMWGCQEAVPLVQLLQRGVEHVQLRVAQVLAINQAPLPPAVRAGPLVAVPASTLSLSVPDVLRPQAWRCSPGRKIYALQVMALAAAWWSPAAAHYLHCLQGHSLADYLRAVFRAVPRGQSSTWDCHPLAGANPTAHEAEPVVAVQQSGDHGQPCMLSALLDAAAGRTKQRQGPFAQENPKGLSSTLNPSEGTWGSPPTQGGRIRCP